ncbi:MAG: hypothetical protein Q8P42_01885 [Gallionella sp.]|nr:hypothetical protein [Gallionella sp.]
MSGGKKRSATEQYGLNVTDAVDLLAHDIVSRMSPLEIGKMIYPDGVAVALCNVPEPVLTDHATRYSQKELGAGQFLKVCNTHVFIVGHETKKAKRH